MQQKFWISAAQVSDEVIFPCGDCTLGSVAAMEMGRDQLVGYIIGVHEGLELSRYFVVQFLQNWFEASCGQVGMEFGVSAEDLTFTLRLQPFRQNGVLES
jgi:hypothetical protein